MDGEYPEGGNFGELVNWHLEHGTLPTGRQNGGLQNKHIGRIVGVSGSAVSNWRHGRDKPAKIEPLLNAFFGPNPLEGSSNYRWRVDMETAFYREKELQSVEKPASRRSTSSLQSEFVNGRDGRPELHQQHRQKELEIKEPLLPGDYPGFADRRHSEVIIKPNNLPFVSIGTLFKGRESALARIHDVLGHGSKMGASGISGLLLHGTGGIGKTRLSIEYALRYSSEYSALLFVRADTLSVLTENLASLATSDLLNLNIDNSINTKERAEHTKTWLRSETQWLLIIDNVDDPSAAEEVMKLLSSFLHGRVLITGRMSQFPAGIRKFDPGTLCKEDSIDFLLERTQDDRAPLQEDRELVGEIATELDGLPLGLEQVASYVAKTHISFAEYLIIWKQNRNKVLDWFDKRLMSYDHETGLAATWLTSVTHLTAKAKHLLDILAFFSPDPIPQSTVDLSLFGVFSEDELRISLDELFAYSLASPAVMNISSSNGFRTVVSANTNTVSAFSIHRLVQDYARRSMNINQKQSALQFGLAWLTHEMLHVPRNVWNNWDVSYADDSLEPHRNAIAMAYIEFAERNFVSGSFEHIAILSAAHLYLNGREAFLKLEAAISAAQKNVINKRNAAIINVSYALLFRFYSTKADANAQINSLVHALSIFQVEKDITSLEATAHKAVIEGIICEENFTHDLNEKLNKIIRDISKYNSEKFEILENLYLIKSISSENILSDNSILAIERLIRQDAGDSVTLLLIRHLENKNKDADRFCDAWKVVCDLLEKNAAFCGTFGISVYEYANKNFNLIAQIFAEQTVWMIVHGISDAHSSYTIKSKARAVWNNILTRIKIKKEIELNTADWGKLSSSLFYQSPETVDVQHLQLGTIIDLMPQHIILDQVNQLSKIDAELYEEPSSFSRKIFASVASEFFRRGLPEIAVNYATRALRIAWQFAIAEDHKSIRDMEDLLIKNNMGCAIVAPTADIKVNLKAQSVNFKSLVHIGIDIVVNEENKKATLLLNRRIEIMKYLSYVKRYLTIHFNDGTYSILDNEMSDKMDKLLRIGLKKFYVIFVRNGRPVEGYDAELLIDTWPE